MRVKTRLKIVNVILRDNEIDVTPVDSLRQNDCSDNKIAPNSISAIKYFRIYLLCVGNKKEINIILRDDNDYKERELVKKIKDTINSNLPKFPVVIHYTKCDVIEYISKMVGV